MVSHGPDWRQILHPRPNKGSKGRHTSPEAAGTDGPQVPSSVSQEVPLFAGASPLSPERMRLTSAASIPNGARNGLGGERHEVP